MSAMSASEGIIEIRGLRVAARVGVPAEERAVPQELRVDLLLAPRRGLAGLEDSLENAVDYAEVARVTEEAAAQGERRLIETLAEEILEAVLAGFPLREAEVRIRKYILPRTRHVAVRLRRRAGRGED